MERKRTRTYWKVGRFDFIEEIYEHTEDFDTQRVARAYAQSLLRTNDYDAERHQVEVAEAAIYEHGEDKIVGNDIC